jgi:hypothetical protein
MVPPEPNGLSIGNPSNWRFRIEMSSASRSTARIDEDVYSFGRVVKSARSSSASSPSSVILTGMDSSDVSVIVPDWMMRTVSPAELAAMAAASPDDVKT